MFAKSLLFLSFFTFDLSKISGNKIKRQEKEFLWGTATAAYQIEGAVSQDKRGSSIWDSFSLIEGKIKNNDNGDIADDSYNKVVEDIELMRNMGVNSYRFSISWSRILPDGYGEINMLGVDHYNFLINELIKNNITPLVTLYHWDLPSGLEDKYEGWLSSNIEQDFVNYADICFQYFGDRVKKWLTINEPWTFSLMGYGAGSFAPGRCSDRNKCPSGNSSTEPYIAAHNTLNAHASAVMLYRRKYQRTQKGEIGIALNLDWAEPLSDAREDVLAASRKNEFSLGWFADPIVFGDYPDSMRRWVGDRLPVFSAEQRKRLKGSYDFFAINHYTTKYYSSAGKAIGSTNNWFEDINGVESKYSSSGELIGPQGASPWLNVVPWGFKRVLKYIDSRYSVMVGGVLVQPRILVTENGCDVPGEDRLTAAEAVHDSFRIEYYSRYLSAMEGAVSEGVRVEGYVAWSLLDNFEWADGYSCRFGLHYVDYSRPDRRRTPKSSAAWFASHIAAHRLPRPRSALQLVEDAVRLLGGAWVKGVFGGAN